MKKLFSTRVRLVLLIAILLAVILAVVSNLTGLSLPDMMVKGVLTPVRAGVSAVVQKAEQMYTIGLAPAVTFLRPTPTIA